MEHPPAQGAGGEDNSTKKISMASQHSVTVDRGLPPFTVPCLLLGLHPRLVARRRRSLVNLLLAGCSCARLRVALSRSQAGDTQTYIIWNIGGSNSTPSFRGNKPRFSPPVQAPNEDAKLSEHRCTRAKFQRHNICLLVILYSPTFLFFFINFTAKSSSTQTR